MVRACKKSRWVTEQTFEQGWRSGESTRLPPLWPGFDSRTRRHMWVEFVVGSRPCSESFSPGSPVFLPPQKSTILNSNSIWTQWMKSHLVEMPLKIPLLLLLLLLLLLFYFRFARFYAALTSAVLILILIQLTRAS